jgi:hypothetical protein
MFDWFKSERQKLATDIARAPDDLRPALPYLSNRTQVRPPFRVQE